VNNNILKIAYNLRVVQKWKHVPNRLNHSTSRIQNYSSMELNVLALCETVALHDP